MESILRAPAIAGIAAVSAGLIAFVPAAPPPTAELRAVQLTSGLGDLVTPYEDLFTNTFANLKAIGSEWLADPAPFLTQIFTNQAGYFDAIWTALGSGDFNEFTGALSDAARGMAQNFLNIIHTATSTAVDLDTSGLLPDIQLPPIGDIVSAILSGNFHGIIQDIINQVGTADLNLGMPIALLIDTLGAPYFGIATMVDSFQNFFQELSDGDWAAAFTTAFTAPATITDAFLNGSGVPLATLLDTLGLGSLVGTEIDLGSVPISIPLIGQGTANLGTVTVEGVSGTLPLGGLLTALSNADVGATVQYSGGEVVFNPICLPIIGCNTPPPITISSNPDVFDVSRTIDGTPLGGLIPAQVNWAPQQLADSISTPVTSSWSEIGTQFQQLPGYLWDQFMLTSIFGDGGWLGALFGSGSGDLLSALDLPAA